MPRVYSHVFASVEEFTVEEASRAEKSDGTEIRFHGEERADGMEAATECV